IGLATLQHPSFLLKTSSWLAIMAIPLTAAGITLTQWYQSSTLEIIAAATVTLAGAGTALGYWNFIIKKRITGWVKALWLTLALALLTSMMLALLYALRFWFITEWLSIPAMRALHGTLNALLVSGGGLLGWHIYTTKSRARTS
ncbi:MAG: YndJ family transporter, partial [Saprospiraceae bacterium]